MNILRDDPYNRVVACPIGQDWGAMEWLFKRIIDDRRAAENVGLALEHNISRMPWKPGHDVLIYSPYAELEA